MELISRVNVVSYHSCCIALGESIGIRDRTYWLLHWLRFRGSCFLCDRPLSLGCRQNRRQSEKENFDAILWRRKVAYAGQTCHCLREKPREAERSSTVIEGEISAEIEPFWISLVTNTEFLQNKRDSTHRNGHKPLGNHHESQAGSIEARSSKCLPRKGWQYLISWEVDRDWIQAFNVRWQHLQFN